MTSTNTVRIYGHDPQAGPCALLSEHDFTSEAEAREFTREAVRAGETLVTFDAAPAGQFAVLAPERGWIWTYSGITRDEAQAIADGLAAGADVGWIVERVG